jgi:ABC-type uncharacterized transport system ATPase subunit
MEVSAEERHRFGYLPEERGLYSKVRIMTLVATRGCADVVTVDY